MGDVDPREVPRQAFDPLVCASYCRKGRDIPYEKVEESVALALKRSGGKLTQAVLKPIRKHFDQYMLLPAKSSDPYYRSLEKVPDLRELDPEQEMAAVEQLYRTVKQDFTVSLVLRFCNPREFGMISQPIRKAARWMGIRVEEKRADQEYVALTRELRKLRDKLGIERVADLDQGLYSLYFRCLVGEGRRCTNFEALHNQRRDKALASLAQAAGRAAELRRLFDEATEQMESLDDPGRSDLLNRLMQAITEIGNEVAEQLETGKRRYFEARSAEIRAAERELKSEFAGLASICADARRLLSGAYLMWKESAEDAVALPGMIAVACGQAFEHELRDVVLSRLGKSPAADGKAWSWLTEHEPVVAQNGDAERVWRAVLSEWGRGPRFDLLINLVRLAADPLLRASPLTQKFRSSLLQSFPALDNAETPEAYGPANFAADLDRLREFRNRCAHDAAAGFQNGPRAGELVFNAPTGILSRLGSK